MFAMPQLEQGTGNHRLQGLRMRGARPPAKTCPKGPSTNIIGLWVSTREINHMVCAKYSFFEYLDPLSCRFGRWDPSSAKPGTERQGFGAALPKTLVV